MKSPKVIVIDIETESDIDGGALMPWRDDFRIKSFGIGTGSKQKAVRHPSAHQITRALKQIIRQDAYVGGWNLRFDFGVMFAMGVDPAVLWQLKPLDGMLLWKRTTWMHRAYEKEFFDKGNQLLSYGLKRYVAEHWPDYADYADLGFDSIKYLKYDVKFTAQAISNEMKKLPEYEWRSFEQECQSITPLAESWVRGMLIDKFSLDALRKDKTKQLNSQLAKVNVTKDVLTSPKKLGELLFDEWGLVSTVKTKGGARSTAKGVLLHLALDDERARHLQLAKAASTTLSKFAKGTEEAMEFNDSDYVYPCPRLAGTYTGRLTYNSKTLKYPTGVALHQWQSDPLVRALFECPEGYSLLEADASGQEMRIMADASDDETMIDMFNTGKDGHSLTGARLSRIPYREIVEHKEGKHKNIRKAGKLCNLSLQFRTSPATFRERAFVQHGMVMTEGEARHNIRAYHSLFPGVKQFHKDAIAEGRRMGYAITRGGRKVRLENYNRSRKWRLDSTAINFPIQGTGADMRHAALSQLRHMMVSGLIKFAWDLHDGLFFYVPTEQAEDIALDIRSQLNKIDYGQWGWTPAVPLTWDVAIGPSWDKLEEVV